MPAKRKPDEPAPEVTIECHRCGDRRQAKLGRDSKTPLVGRGWKSIDDGPHAGLWCEACWKKTFVPRSITIPISGPVGIVQSGRRRDPVIEAAEWKDLRLALRQCWQWSTAVANWATLELVKADTPRTPEMTKLGPAPKPYLYPGAKLVAPGMDSQAIIAVLNTVQRNYFARRLDVLWKRDASLPCYRYPYPYIVDRDGWEPVKAPATGRPAIRVTLAGKKWILQLAGGFRNRRKIDGWKRIFAGECIRRELAIEGKTVTRSAHRSGLPDKAPGGGQSAMTRVVVRISAWFPRQEVNQEPGNVLEVRTGSNAFLSYRVSGDEQYRHIHADHVRRWRNQYMQRSRRFAHDMKFEKRWPSRVRRQMGRRQEQDRTKFANRMDTWLNEVTKIVATYAYRRRCAKVVLDMTDQSFAQDGFPWFKLKQLMEQKLDERRIAAEIVGYKDDEKDEGETPADVPGVRRRGAGSRRKASAGLSARADESR